MNASSKEILVIGYGNPGRLDDGLGPALAEALDQKNIAGVTVESNYLLTVEDAADIAEHDVVIFADAAVSGPEPFSFKAIEPKTSLSFSSHHNEPASILGLAYELFSATTTGYVLAIRGYQFNDFGLILSEQAQNNLLDSIDFLDKILRNKNFQSGITAN